MGSVAVTVGVDVTVIVCPPPDGTPNSVGVAVTFVARKYGPNKVFKLLFNC